MRQFIATLPALVLAAGLAQPAAAQQRIESLGATITTNVSLTTDYMFRGLSQTRSRPAIQGSLDIEHSSGLYVGGFASNVDFLGLDANIELDALAGYRFTVLGIKFDVGAIYYAYPGYTRPDGGFRLDYLEVAGRASYEAGPVTFLASVYYSPDYQLQSGVGVYAEGGVDIRLPFEFVGSARLGHQSVERNERFGTPSSFVNWGLSLSRDLYGFTFTVGYTDTNIRRRECGGGQDICRGRVLASVSRRF